ncbi:MAG: trypsin-like peptidase domain-containing protein [Cyclobacteriaceae bacterium]|nr:trypsin-like peptidase domain-containing protein [Cyclobacteriaceae bacterium]
MKNKSALVFILLTLSSSSFAQEISKLYSKVNPTVVLIKVEGTELITDRSTLSKKTVSTSGIGSGVVISEDGKVMTANHVISGAENIVVEFLDGEKVPANVVTADKGSDVALLKLVWIPKSMEVAKMGNSDQVQIGDPIIVIGAPYGLSHSLSKGIISGRHSDSEFSEGFTRNEFFQTDASINHGNSGGPMFNMNGEVIGLVSFILSESGGFDGIGFAATINIAKVHLLGEQPFWFGLEFIPLTGELAKIFNLPQPMGLAVQKLVSTSPGAIAGLKAGIYETEIEGFEFLTGGDIILAVDKFIITEKLDLEEFRSYFANMKSGTSFKIKIFRAGQIKELTVVAP